MTAWLICDRFARELNFWKIKRPEFMKSLKFPTFMLIVLTATISQTVAQPPAAYRFAGGKTTASIPFENDFGLIFVKMKVNNSGILWFLLDTGFDVNVLNAALAKPLNLELKDKQTIPAPGGEVEIGSASNLDFNLNGVKLTGQNAKTMPLSSLEPVIGRRLDGILGHDFLEQFVVEIDYTAKIITLRRSENYKYKGRGEMLPVAILNKEPFIHGAILQPGRLPIEGKFKVDTGSVDVVGLNKNFLEEQKVLNTGQRSVAEPGVAVGGETTGISFRVGSLRFGNFDLKNPVIGATLDSGGFENRADAGTLGAGVLSRFRVILDYRHGHIILEKNRRFLAPFVHDTSGIRMTAEGKSFEIVKVARVLKDSPAAIAGILEGDIIKSVNGFSVERLNLSEIREILLRGSGKTCRLSILRGTSDLVIPIRLRDVI